MGKTNGYLLARHRFVPHWTRIVRADRWNGDPPSYIEVVAAADDQRSLQDVLRGLGYGLPAQIWECPECRGEIRYANPVDLQTHGYDMKRDLWDRGFRRGDPTIESFTCQCSFWCAVSDDYHLMRKPRWRTDDWVATDPTLRRTGGSRG